MIDQAVHSILISNAALAALVGVKIYNVEAPQESVVPVVVFQKISATGRELYHRGVLPHCETRWQFTCIGETVTQAKQVAAAVIAALHGYYGASPDGSGFINYCRIENEVDIVDPETDNSVVAVDALMSHKEG